MALPEFGLMTKADKQKLDGIDTSTLLTKTEATSTYATKAEMREYVKQVLESDTGYAFLNGNGSEVGVITALKSEVPLQNPNLTVSMNGTTVGDSFEMGKRADYFDAYFDVSRNGSGVITVTDTANYLSFDSSANQITQSFGKWGPSDGDSTTVTVELASDGTYDSSSKVFTLTYKDPGAFEPGEPIVEEPLG